MKKVLSKDLKIGFPEGNLKKICTIGKDNVIILMWNFTKYICCSKASEDEFANTFSYENYFAILKDSLKGKGDISLLYFTLHPDKIIAEIIEEQDFNYTFPDSSEGERLQYLSTSLIHHGYRVKTWSSTKTTDHYCEFSGGGDLHIAEKLSSVIVFVVP